MICIIDPSSIGVQHEQFNASFIQLLIYHEKEENFVIFAEASHVVYLKSKLVGHSSRISYRPMRLYEERGGLKEFVRAYRQYKLVTKILSESKDWPVKRAYVLLLQPLAHFLLKRWGNPPFPLNVVMHGELESIKLNKHFTNRVWGYFLRKALSNRLDGLEYIVLGKPILSNIYKYLPKFDSKVILIDHPYPFSSREEPIRLLGRPHRDPISLALFGVATIYKSSQFFFEIAQQVSQSVKPNITFKVLGRVYQDMKAYLNNAVSYKRINQSYTREELEQEMPNIHFSVFYYNNDDHSLCPSGSFWDSIDAEVPMLYVKNDYFDYYASLVGPLGMVFDNPQSLNTFIMEMNTKGIDITAYEFFVRNIRLLKYDRMTIPSISNQLKYQ